MRTLLGLACLGIAGVSVASILVAGAGVELKHQLGRVLIGNDQLAIEVAHAIEDAAEAVPE